MAVLVNKNEHLCESYGFLHCTEGKNGEKLLNKLMTKLCLGILYKAISPGRCRVVVVSGDSAAVFETFWLLNVLVMT